MGGIRLNDEKYDKLVNKMLENLQPYFKLQKINTIYSIHVVDNPYQKKYNFFFVIVKKKQRTRSIPIGILHDYRMEALEELCHQLKQKVDFTLRFENFEAQTWDDGRKVYDI